MKQTKVTLPLRIGVLTLVLGAGLALTAVELSLSSVRTSANVAPVEAMEALPQVQTEAAVSETQEETQTEAELEREALTLRAQEGRVCVYRGETLWIQTEISVLSLPEADRLLLENGITVGNKTEMHQLLEDLGA